MESVSGSPAPVVRTLENETAKDSLVADSPRTGQRSVSSCSNSPSSVRVNQEYIAKLLATSNRDEDEGKEATNSEDDIDMLDAKTPLLKEKNSTIIVESNSSSHSNGNSSNSNSNIRTE